MCVLLLLLWLLLLLLLLSVQSSTITLPPRVCYAYLHSGRITVLGCAGVCCIGSVEIGRVGRGIAVEV